MKTKTTQFKSNCCNADIIASVPLNDFPGKKKQLLGTWYYICKKCGVPCDIHLNSRKFWNRNPSEKVIQDKRSKIKSKQVIEEIGNA